MKSSPVTGQDGSCLMCSAKEWRLAVRSEDVEYQCKPGPFDLVECAKCGHVYIHPMPKPEEVSSLYPSWYYTVNPKSPIYLDGKVVEGKLVQDAKRLRKLTEGTSVRSIVDIGGGNLTRLIKLKEVFGEGVEAICLDLQFDRSALDAAAAAGVKMVQGNVETDVGALRDNGHDLIIMRQLLEHLRDPRAALRRLHPKLSPNGLLVIDTPNRGGLDYWLFRGQHWGGYHIPRHFHLFTQASLARLIEESGYRVFLKGYLPSLAFWIISFRNLLGLNSIERGRSWFEFLYLKNLPISGAFFLLDALSIRLGIPSSNQFVIARKEDGGAGGEGAKDRLGNR